MCPTSRITDIRLDFERIVKTFKAYQALKEIDPMDSLLGYMDIKESDEPSPFPHLHPKAIHWKFKPGIEMYFGIPKDGIPHNINKYTLDLEDRATELGENQK